MTEPKKPTARPALPILSNGRSQDKEPVIVQKSDQFKLSDFEVHRWPYLLILPFMWMITIYVMAKKFAYSIAGLGKPRTNTIWFDGLGQSCRRVKDGQSSWRALDEIYNYQFGTGFNVRTLVSDFWEGMINCQAVRNRLKLAKQEVRQAILQFSADSEVRILSLAAGSAQGVIEVMAEFKGRGVRVKAMLVDIDQSALEYAHKLACTHGVADQIETSKTSVSQVVRICKDFKPQIVEMLGMLDYIPQKKAIRLIGKIYESLGKKGVFLTCNICPNVERWFIRWVVDWPMIYRTPEELDHIVTEAGFRNRRLVCEPLQVHAVVVVQK